MRFGERRDGELTRGQSGCMGMRWVMRRGMIGHVRGGRRGRRVYKSMISTSLAASKRHTPRSHSSSLIDHPPFLGMETTATRTSDLPPRSHHATDPVTIQMALLCRMYYQGFRLGGYLLIIR
jgi:hypothetical protein